MSEGLRKGILTALRADQVLREMKLPIFDTGERGNQADLFPYIELGQEIEYDDSADCVDGERVSIAVHCWARRKDAYISRRMARRVKICLLKDNSINVGLEDALVSFTHVSTQHVPDPDTTTEHAVVTFEALTEIFS